MRKPAFSHVHTQDTPSADWTIEHGLNSKPSVAVQVMYNGELQSILPNGIEYVDDNTVIVHFTTAYTGSARLV